LNVGITSNVFCSKCYARRKGLLWRQRNSTTLSINSCGRKPNLTLCSSGAPMIWIAFLIHHKA
jgi:hypothetical protein